MSDQDTQLPCPSDPALSPIINGYINTCNSEYISQGFISSTPIRSSPKRTTLFARKSFQPTLVYQENKENNENEEKIDVATIVMQILNKMNQFEAKLDQIDSKVKNMQSEFTDFKNEQQARHLAENRLGRKTYCMCEMINRKINKLTSEESFEDEVNLLLPANTIAELSDIESKLADATFRSKFVSLLKSKRSKLGFDGLFRIIAKDDVYFEFNVDGRCKKRSLLNLVLFKETLYKATSGLTIPEYESHLRKSVLKAHNRVNKLNSLAKNKEKTAASK